MRLFFHLPTFPFICFLAAAAAEISTSTSGCQLQNNSNAFSIPSSTQRRSNHAASTSIHPSSSRTKKLTHRTNHASAVTSDGILLVYGGEEDSSNPDPLFIWKQFDSAAGAKPPTHEGGNWIVPYQHRQNLRPPQPKITMPLTQNPQTSFPSSLAIIDNKTALVYSPAAAILRKSSIKKRHSSKSTFRSSIALLNTESWTWKYPKTTGKEPTIRSSAPIAAHNNIVYIFGGKMIKFKDTKPGSGPLTGSLHALNAKTMHWSKLPSTDPVVQHSMCYNPILDALIIYGGMNEAQASSPRSGLHPSKSAVDWLRYFNLKTKRWSKRISPSGKGPGPRKRHTATCLPNGQMVIYGGSKERIYDPQNSNMQDVLYRRGANIWVLNVTSAEKNSEPNRWRFSWWKPKVTGVRDSPGPRMGHSSALNGTEIIFNGGVGAGDAQHMADTYKLSTVDWKWKRLLAGGSADARSNESVASNVEISMALPVSSTSIRTSHDDTILNSTDYSRPDAIESEQSDVATGPSNRLIYGASVGGGFTLFFTAGMSILSKMRKKNGETVNAENIAAESGPKTEITENEESFRKPKMIGTTTRAADSIHESCSLDGGETQLSTPTSGSTIIWITESVEQTTNHLQDDLGRLSFSSIRKAPSRRDWSFPKLINAIAPYRSARRSSSVSDTISRGRSQPPQTPGADTSKRDFWKFLKSQTFSTRGSRSITQAENATRSPIAFPKEGEGGATEQIADEVETTEILRNPEAASIVSSESDSKPNPRTTRPRSSLATLSSFQHLAQLSCMEDSDINQVPEIADCNDNSIYAAGIFMAQQNAHVIAPSPTESEMFSRDYEYLGSFIANNTARSPTGSENQSFRSMQEQTHRTLSDMSGSVRNDSRTEEGSMEDDSFESSPDPAGPSAASTSMDHQASNVVPFALSPSYAVATDIKRPRVPYSPALIRKGSSQTTTTSATLSDYVDDGAAPCSSPAGASDQHQEVATLYEVGVDSDDGHAEIAPRARQMKGSWRPSWTKKAPLSAGGSPKEAPFPRSPLASSVTTSPPCHPNPSDQTDLFSPRAKKANAGLPRIETAILSPTSSEITVHDSQSPLEKLARMKWPKLGSRILSTFYMASPAPSPRSDQAPSTAVSRVDRTDDLLSSDSTAVALDEIDGANVSALRRLGDGHPAPFGVDVNRDTLESMTDNSAYEWSCHHEGEVSAIFAKGLSAK